MTKLGSRKSDLKEEFLFLLLTVQSLQILWIPPLLVSETGETVGEE